MAFDELDKRIVAALVDDGRATYAEVGAQVGLSASAVKRRVDRLRALQRQRKRSCRAVLYRHAQAGLSRNPRL